MSPHAVIRLVMSREIRQRLRSRAFLVSTVLLCVGVLVAVPPDADVVIRNRRATEILGVAGEGGAVGGGGPDALDGKRRVAHEDLRLTHPLGQRVEHDAHRDPGATHARLAVADRRVDREVQSASCW